MALLLDRRTVFSAIASASAVPILGTRTASASGLPKPTDKPILTVQGRISVTNADDAAQFDRAMLESLGVQKVETTTPWYPGTVRFEGVSLAKLMRTVGASGDKVAVVALNDYSSEIPIEDFARFDPILALKRDGEYMPVRDKGPLFVIYPYDSVPELKHQKYYSRSVWQVAKIIVR
ncbi:MAG: oxidoreductase [Alphaproteobacteria bacterium]|nr:oxidoreductase [Alphaproteobacteria bacterium]